MKKIIQALLLSTIFLSCSASKKTYTIDEILSSAQIDPKSKYIHSNVNIFSFDNIAIFFLALDIPVYNKFLDQ